MPKFRKRPVVIEAIQWTGENNSEIIAFVGAKVDFHHDDEDHFLTIQTLEGDTYGDPLDWIIKGIKGEFYPCKRDIFESTYELVEESEVED